MRAKYLAGTLITLAILTLAIYVSGGKMLTFVDLPSTVLIVLIPAAIAFSSWPVKDMARAFSAPFDRMATRKELEKSRLFFDSLRTWILIAAFLGTMIGLVCILAYADGRNLDKLGRNLSVMLLCIFQALLLLLVLPLPLSALARRRIAELE